MAHTKGPWKVFRCFDKTKMEIVGPAPKDHFWLATIQVGEDTFGLEGEANARLIAACPEMYEQLVRALAVINSPESFEIELVLEDIRNVLRKAEQG